MRRTKCGGQRLKLEDRRWKIWRSAWHGRYPAGTTLDVRRTGSATEGESESRFSPFAPVQIRLSSFRLSHLSSLLSPFMCLVSFVVPLHPPPLSLRFLLSFCL